MSCTSQVSTKLFTSSFLRTRSSSDISWIGSIQACLLLLGSVVAGPLYDSGYLRTLVIMGSVLVVFGMMMTSLCTEFWQLILAQGLIVGLGNGCLFVPSIALLPTYFTSQRAFAMGIAASGSSIGEQEARGTSKHANSITQEEYCTLSYFINSSQESASAGQRV